MQDNLPNYAMNVSSIQWIGAIIFLIAVLHTLSTQFFEHLAHTQPARAGIWHLLGEVEIAFGFWALVFMLFMFTLQGAEPAIRYLESRQFNEPLFVFVMMVVAASRPILCLVSQCVVGFARCLLLPKSLGYYFCLLALVPILGSLITEPAAITLAALLLRDIYFNAEASNRFKYATLGVLLVNISIGGTLTAFSAPPVLMVAKVWQWDTLFMLTHFGWKAIIAVIINAGILTILFRKDLLSITGIKNISEKKSVPPFLQFAHLLFLVGIVIFSHHSIMFVGLFLLFLGVAKAYEQYQDRLMLREGLLVAFFLAGLVILGGQQSWWLQPLLEKLNVDTLFWGATLMTAITDNAALTYLGAQVHTLSADFKYALVAGAVTGGGLTVIANAPNPAAFSILRDKFTDQTIHPAGLFFAALLPTAIAALAFQLF